MKLVTMFRRLYLPFLLVLPISQAAAQKTLALMDKTYEPQIRSVQCYPNQPVDATMMMPAAATLRQQDLVIEFDDLVEERNNYYVKMIHCNFDWTKSTLMDLDIMKEYNEFTISEYSFSINTHVPYVHYRFQVPPVKLPGNYVVIVYRDGNKQDLILSHRIMVYDNRMALAQDDRMAGLGNVQSTNQALNFIVSYGNTEIINPMSSVHLTIRQNQRWDNAKSDIKPSFIRENSSQLEYRFFDMDNTFQAGNEFRFVDFRSLNNPGQNTFKVDKSRKPYDVVVALDAPRGTQAYSQYADLDGGFYIDNMDYRQEPWVSANYVNVNFGLQSPKLNGDVYIIGAYNGWARTEENKMVHNQGMYSQRMLLKQGFYNYQYWVDGAGLQANQIEGSHFQTENIYEVLVYYRPFQPNADLLIGYFIIPVNPR
jgi:hypothetical protein